VFVLCYPWRMDMYSALGIFLAPVGALLIFGGVALPIKWLIATRMPDCWFKRELLRQRWESKCSSANRRVLEQAARYTRKHS
jgi:hypothetical protein